MRLEVLTVDALRSHHTYSIYGNLRISTDVVINGFAPPYCTPYPPFSLKSSQPPLPASEIPSGPPFWAPYIRKLPTFGKSHDISQNPLHLSPPLSTREYKFIMTNIKQTYSPNSSSAPTI